MSAQAPQVLSRRTNGAPSHGANPTNESSSVRPSPFLSPGTTRRNSLLCAAAEPTQGHDRSSDSRPKAKAAGEGGAAARSSRGKGSSDKGSEAKSTNNDAEAPKPPRSKAPSEGEKLVVRRLPPGMTQAEFVSILGQEWEIGKGRVDWFHYARGKVSNDPSKPTRPGRAYLHLMRKDYILPLSETVRSACWEDAKNTFNSPSLVGPPSLEFASYKKVPGNKKRTDARQGTIDQDPEFMAFLEGLANPTPFKDGPENEEGEDGGKTEITTTPLIEYLKEKKANRIKEAAAAKSAKHSRLESSSKSRTSGKETEGSSSRKGRDRDRETKSAKSDKVSLKENVKILTKKATVEQVAETARNVANQITGAAAGTSTASTSAPASSSASASASAPASASASAESAPKNRRAGIAQAARILQRDLGLSPGSAHRRARQDAAKADADSKTTTTGKDTAQAPQGRESQSSSAPPAEPVPAQPQQTPKAQPSSSATSKAQSSSRRSRGSGGKNSERSKNTELVSAENPTPAAPVILKKKSTSEADAPRAATAASDTPSSQSKTVSTTTTTTTTNSKANMNTPSSSKAGSSQKTSGSTKKGNTNTNNNSNNSNSNNNSNNNNSSNSSSAAARGFVKHVSASQGMSEPALRQALEAFGPITSLEVDKRKGFAYVDFADPASLARAISGGPIAVAQGSVSVMERKDKKPAAAAGASTSSGAGSSAPAAAGAAAAGAGAGGEKGTSRGRRGRGGGGGGNEKKQAASSNGTQGAEGSAANGPG